MGCSSPSNVPEKLSRENEGCSWNRLVCSYSGAVWRTTRWLSEWHWRWKGSSEARSEQAVSPRLAHIAITGREESAVEGVCGQHNHPSQGSVGCHPSSGGRRSE